MLYVLYCLDKPDHASARGANRDAHRVWLGTQKDRIFSAGPLVSDDGATVVGSLLIIECESRADAEAFRDADPYNQVGLFQSVEIRRWNRVPPGP